MKAKRISKFGFTCPDCNEIHTPDEKIEKNETAFRCSSCETVQIPEEGEQLEAQKAWRIDGPLVGADNAPPHSAGWVTTDLDGDGGVTEVQLYNYHEDCYGEDDPGYGLYVYADDGSDVCAGEDEPEYLDAWECGKCETVYLDKDEAKECCK